MSSILESGLNFGEILEGVGRQGAVSVSALNEQNKQNLLTETKSLFTPIAGESPRIYVETSNLPRGGKLRLVQKELRHCLIPHYNKSINKSFVLWYQKPRGLSIHRDFEPPASFCRYTYILKLGGIGRFFIFDDQTGTNPQEIDSSEGNLIVIRSNVYHTFKDIVPPAYSFVLRQK